jgi:hypothetical protein
MAVRESCGTTFDRLYRFQVRKRQKRHLRKICKSMNALARIDVVGVETSYEGVYVPGVGAIDWKDDRKNPRDSQYRATFWCSS